MPGTLGAPLLRRAREALKNGQCEGGCLPGPGLGDATEVAAAENPWDGLCLDRGGCRVALDGERVEDRGRKSEIGEAGQDCGLSGSLGSEKGAHDPSHAPVGSRDDPRDGAVKGRAGIKIKPKSHHFGGNTLTRARSRNSKQEHEHCLPYMLAGHALVKTVALVAGEPPGKTAKAFDSIT